MEKSKWWQNQNIKSHMVTYSAMKFWVYISAARSNKLGMFACWLSLVTLGVDTHLVDGMYPYHPTVSVPPTPSPAGDIYYCKLIKLFLGRPLINPSSLTILKKVVEIHAFPNTDISWILVLLRMLINMLLPLWGCKTSSPSEGSKQYSWNITSSALCKVRSNLWAFMTSHRPYTTENINMLS